MLLRSGGCIGRVSPLVGAVLTGACAILACSSSSPTRAAPAPAEETTTPPNARATPKPEPSRVDSGVGASNGSPPPSDLYDPDTIPHFELTLDGAAMAILSNPAEAEKKTWVHGQFKFGAVTFADVGVRRKGSYSFRALPKKAPLKIKFNKWVKGQKLRGLEELTLNNNLSDHTYLEQRLALHIFRSAGLPAMKANSAQLTINGEDYGVYTNVETPDENFLARVFGAKAKTLYEVEGDGSSWMPGSDSSWESDIPDPGAPVGTKPDLDALFQAVATAKDATLLADLESHLHTKQYLQYCAVEGITGQHDGYAYGFFGSHNYFMAGDSDGKFSLIPWSMDTTFVASSGAEIDVAKPMPDNVLLARCSRNVTCWNSYKAEMQSMLAAYEALDVVNLAKKWHEQIDALARSDPKREHDISFYASQTDRMYEWMAARPQVIRQQLGL
jgi:hypothetical protein